MFNVFLFCHTLVGLFYFYFFFFQGKSCLLYLQAPLLIRAIEGDLGR